MPRAVHLDNRWTESTMIKTSQRQSAKSRSVWLIVLGVLALTGLIIVTLPNEYCDDCAHRPFSSGYALSQKLKERFPDGHAVQQDVAQFLRPHTVLLNLSFLPKHAAERDRPDFQIRCNESRRLESDAFWYIIIIDKERRDLFIYAINRIDFSLTEMETKCAGKPR